MTHRKAHTYDQAAEMLGVSGETIRQLVNKGELLTFTVTDHAEARSKRISDQELDRFIAEREEAQRRKLSAITLNPAARRNSA